MAKVIGIDLGTTNSCIATLDNGTPIIVPNAEGGRTTPSVVALNDIGKAELVGAAAKRQAVMHPENTVFSIKRFMGRQLREVDSAQQNVPYHVGANNKGMVQVELGSKTVAPEQISAMILQKLKQDAEAFLGQEVNQAVVTVPAYFNDAQRKATQDAGKIAGLEVLRIINEPTAAALAYGLDKVGEEQTILVFDLGGGTFDVSILEVGEGVFEVRSTAGDNRLGGDDFDRALVEWMAGEFSAQHSIDLTKDNAALQRLYEAAEKAKVELSTAPQSEISLPFIHADANGPLHLEYRITRAKLDELCKPLVARVNGPVEQALADADMTPDDIDHVVLVGGMTRMPAVQERVRELIGRDPYRGVNPDEVVGIGAAIQGGVITGEVNDVLLLDVTPLTLGIETKGGVTTVLIERNTTIPTRVTEIFTTAEDDQHSVEIHIVQGEREMASDNRTLARLQLLGIPPAPRGVPQIEVSFDIDANGVFNVHARDLGTGNEQQLQVQTENLDSADIEQMIREANEHAETDRRRRETAEQRNGAEALLYHAGTAITDYEDYMDEGTQQELIACRDSLRTALMADGDTFPAAETDQLKLLLHTIAENLYAGGGAASVSEQFTPSIAPDNLHEAEQTIAEIGDEGETRDALAVEPEVQLGEDIEMEPDLIDGEEAAEETPPNLDDYDPLSELGGADDEEDDDDLQVQAVE